MLANEKERKCKAQEQVFKSKNCWGKLNEELVELDTAGKVLEANCHNTLPSQTHKYILAKPKKRGNITKKTLWEVKVEQSQSTKGF